MGRMMSGLCCSSITIRLMAVFWLNNRKDVGAEGGRRETVTRQPEDTSEAAEQLGWRTTSPTRAARVRERRPLYSPLQVLLSSLREKWAGHPQTKLLTGTARHRWEQCPLVEVQAFQPPWREEWNTKMSIT